MLILSRAIKLIKRVSLGLSLVFVCEVAQATEGEMPNGATTLSNGTTTFSLNLGADFPEPTGYSLRFDHGVTDRYQFGVSGGYLEDLAAIALHNRYELAQSDDRMHTFGLELDIGYVHIDDSFDTDEDIRNNILLTQPNVAYEWRPFAKRRTGFYVKAGSVHAFDLDDGDTGTGGRAVLGVQHQFGKTFSMTAQAGVLLPGAVVAWKLGFSWAL